jgi:uncharacterized cupin superfamily protein
MHVDQDSSQAAPLRLLVAADTAIDPHRLVKICSDHAGGGVWGMASADLNATLLAWPPGHEVAAHRNSELDVLLIVLEGGGVAKVDEQEDALVPGTALLIEEGRSRVIRAGADGVRYLSVHRRRGPLQVAGMPERR